MLHSLDIIYHHSKIVRKKKVVPNQVFYQMSDFFLPCILQTEKKKKKKNNKNKIIYRALVEQHQPKRNKLILEQFLVCQLNLLFFIDALVECKLDEAVNFSWQYFFVA